MIGGRGLAAPADQPVRGVDVAVEVEAVGAGVTRFAPGDEGSLRCDRRRFAEYALAREGSLVGSRERVVRTGGAAIGVAGRTALQVCATRRRSAGAAGVGLRRRGASDVRRADREGARSARPAVTSTRNLDWSLRLGPTMSSTTPRGLHPSRQARTTCVRRRRESFAVRSESRHAPPDAGSVGADKRGGSAIFTRIAPFARSAAARQRTLFYVANRLRMISSS